MLLIGAACDITGACCRPAELGCDGICNSTKAVDECGLCDGDGTTCGTQTFREAVISSGVLIAGAGAAIAVYAARLAISATFNTIMTTAFVPNAR